MGVRIRTRDGLAGKRRGYLSMSAAHQVEALPNWLAMEKEGWGALKHCLCFCISALFDAISCFVGGQVVLWDISLRFWIWVTPGIQNCESWIHFFWKSIFALLPHIFGGSCSLLQVVYNRSHVLSPATHSQNSQIRIHHHLHIVDDVRFRHILLDRDTQHSGMCFLSLWWWSCQSESQSDFLLVSQYFWIHWQFPHIF